MRVVTYSPNEGVLHRVKERHNISTVIERSVNTVKLPLGVANTVHKEINYRLWNHSLKTSDEWVFAKVMG